MLLQHADDLLFCEPPLLHLRISFRRFFYRADLKILNFIWSKLSRAGQGAVLILEGESSVAEMFGFQASKDHVVVASVMDLRRPKLPIVWQKALELPRFKIPKKARLFCRERWTGAPLVAGYRSGAGAVLWVAASPGENGYERFPYLLHALGDLGLEAPFRSANLWAFFDSSYRSAWTSSTSPGAGALPVSPPCTWQPGIFMNRIPNATATCELSSKPATATPSWSMPGSSCLT